MLPFTQNPDESVSTLGEIKIINRIRSAFEKITSPAPRGMGDDCAVLPIRSDAGTRTRPQHRLVTTDSLIFAKHFDETVSPENAGKKLVRRNASDIAAMGGVPSDAVLSFIMSGDISTTWLDAFLHGIAEACEECKIELCGGDVASAPGSRFFAANLSLTGFAESPLLRTGALEGDFLFVTGTLGGSILKKHFDFRPRLTEGNFLATLPSGIVRSCIDVTDGLLKDHAALLPPNTHAEFDFEALPIADDAKKLGGNLTRRAFCDGEDYELLFAIAGIRADYFESLWDTRFPDTKLTRIAKIVAGTANPSLSKHLADAHAYEHFL